MTERMRHAAGAVVTLILALAGLYAGNQWLAHGWAANVADARADWHRAWSVRFFVAMCICFGAAIAWALRRRWWGRARPAD